MKPLDIRTFPLEGISLIEASAGTGKTWTIARLYLRALLELRLEVHQVLVVTFTHAATQELRGRIRALLKALLDRVEQNSETDPEDLDRWFGQWIGDTDAAKHLRTALLGFDEAAIHSIHGFARRAQQIYPLETGALLTQEVQDDDAILQRQAIRDFWRRASGHDEPPSLPDLMRHWTTPDQLLEQVEALIDHIDAFDIESARAAWQRSRRAQQALAERLQAAYQDIDLQQALIDDDAWNRKRLNPATLQSLITAIDDQGDLNLPALQQHPNRHLLRHSFLSESVRQRRTPEYIDHLLFRLVDEYLDGFETEHTRHRRLLMLEAASFVAEAVRRAREHQQSISFDEQIRGLERALDERPALAQMLAERYPLAMVDEFQDTDQHQYRIFRLVYRHRPGKGLVMIGDPKQAIYSFRGADVFTYQKARADAGDERQFTLQQNYRSTPSLVEAVNRLFTQTRNPFIFDRLMRFHPVQAGCRHKRLLRGDAEMKPLALMHMPWQEKAINRGDAWPYLAAQCADQIARLLKDRQIRLVEDEHSDGRVVEAGDIAVLVRNHAQGMRIRQALAERGMGSAMIQKDSVFESGQAQDIDLLLEFLIDSSSIDRLHGLLATDLFGLDAAAIARLQQDGSRQVEWLDAFRRYREQAEKHGLMAMLMRLFDEQSTVPRILKTAQGERCLTNWLQIMELLQQEARRHASLHHSLGWLIAQMRGSEPGEAHQLQLESDRNLVRILTLHKSKGLQYPIVFLPFIWAEQVQPAHRGSCYRVHDEQGNERFYLLDDQAADAWRLEQLAENMRLFYVAVTRAEYRCYLGWGFINQIADSGPARCLYVAGGGGEPDLKKTSEDEFLEPWRALGDCIEFLDPAPAGEPETLPPDRSEPAPPRRFGRRLEQQWRVSSFTQLAHGASGDAVEWPEQDEQEARDPAADQLARRDRFHFEKGARAGNFLHGLLELQDFTRPFDRGELRDRCLSYGYEPEWAPVLADWLDEVLDKDLGGWRLRDLPMRQRQVELEFHLSSKGLTETALNRLLHDERYLMPGQQLGFGVITGFLKGYIDLVCEHDGRYFVIDYKSNHLGYRFEDYHEAACRAAMLEHHYHLQYLIYCLALHRLLRLRLPDYDYERHFGGVRYLFLRGITTRSAEPFGIVSERPRQAVIERLDRLLGGGTA